MPARGRLSVLLCDHDSSRLLHTQAALQAVGASVDTVAAGPDAVYHAMVARYDLLVLRHDLPLIDGSRTLRALRGAEAEEGLGRMWVVVSTSADPDEISADYRGLGVLEISTPELLPSLVETLEVPASRTRRVADSKFRCSSTPDGRTDTAR